MSPVSPAFLSQDQAKAALGEPRVDVSKYGDAPRQLSHSQLTAAAVPKASQNIAESYRP